MKNPNPLKMRLFTNRIFLLILISNFFTVNLSAQTEIDGLFMGKNNICGGFNFTKTSWKNYWEGTYFRDNENLGTVKSNQVGLMGNFGINSKTNVIFSTSYIHNWATQGTLIEQKGIQDLNLFLKNELWAKNINGYLTSLVSVLGVSSPISNYVADYLPLSIGLGAKTASVRILTDIQKKSMFMTFSGSYLGRSNVTIDRNSYYTDRLVYSNQVNMPNACNFNLRFGYRQNPDNYIEIVGDYMNTIGGFDIRKNDMPFISNDMEWTRIAISGKKGIPRISGLSIMGGAFCTLAGRNMGQSTGWSAAAVYQHEF